MLFLDCANQLEINSAVACFVGIRDDDVMNILFYNLDNYFDSAYEHDFWGSLAVRTTSFHWLLDQFNLIAYVGQLLAAQLIQSVSSQGWNYLDWLDCWRSVFSLRVRRVFIRERQRKRAVWAKRGWGDTRKNLSAAPYPLPSLLGWNVSPHNPFLIFREKNASSPGIDGNVLWSQDL